MIPTSATAASVLAWGQYGYSMAGSGVYLMIFLGTLALSGVTWLILHSTYGKWSKVPASSGLTGAQVAQRILDLNGISDVSIHMIPGKLTDHYDPANKRLMLSEDTYQGTSVASLGVAAHECGHAIQHQHLYSPLQWRMAAVGATQIASTLVYWLPLIAMFGLLPWKSVTLIMALCFGVLMLFQLITLPVEFDATRRAKKIIPELGAVASGKEYAGMSRVLDAAALTYVAAFISTLAYFLYYLLRLQNRRD